MEIKQGMMTVGEMKLFQEFAKASDINIAIQLLAGRTGLEIAQVEALNMVDYQRLLMQLVQVATQSMDQTAALLAAEALMQNPDA
jgi:hypothetical protein